YSCYILSLHDALPIYESAWRDFVKLCGDTVSGGRAELFADPSNSTGDDRVFYYHNRDDFLRDRDCFDNWAVYKRSFKDCLAQLRSEEHTSELQSRENL